MVYTRYNIAIIPPEPIRKLSIGLSERLAERSGRFILDEERLMPHISLYHIPLAPGDLERVKRTLRVVTSRISPFILHHDGFRSSEDGWVDAHFTKSDPILALHHLLLSAFRSAWCRTSAEYYRQSWSVLSREQQRNVSLSGWSECDRLFEPHLTFTRLTQPNPDILEAFSPEGFSFCVEHIGLFVLGELGTCVEKLEEYSLGSHER